MSSANKPESKSSSAPDGLHEREVLRDFDEHRESLRRMVASKLGPSGAHAIDDVMQEVAMAANEARDRSVGPSNAGAWLRQVAINKVHDYWRRVGREKRLHTDFSENEAMAGQAARSPYEWVIALERRDAVVEALGSLADEDRAMLEKKYLHGQSCREIAENSNLTIKAVDYRLDRARKAMRALIERTRQRRES